MIPSRSSSLLPHQDTNPDGSTSPVCLLILAMVLNTAGENTLRKRTFSIRSHLSHAQTKRWLLRARPMTLNEPPIVLVSAHSLEM